jgi:hypothetical protein
VLRLQSASHLALSREVAEMKKSAPSHEVVRLRQLLSNKLGGDW